MSDFEKWLEDQDFYTNMRFIHGDKLLDRDGDVYRVLPVQMAYQAWDYRKAQLNNMEACYIGKKKECEELQGQVDEALEEIQRALNCCESTETACVLGELVKVLRGDHE